MGTDNTAPKVAIQLAERAQFVREHPGWTFADYDNASAGDIAFMRSYETMIHEAEKQAIAKAQEEATA